MTAGVVLVLGPVQLTQIDGEFFAVRVLQGFGPGDTDTRHGVLLGHKQVVLVPIFGAWTQKVADDQLRSRTLHNQNH